jgi:hypothetical protein
MIAVRVALDSVERVRLETADRFLVNDKDQMLEVYNGAELVAIFREWAYAVKIEGSVGPDEQLPLPSGIRTVTPSRPLNLGGGAPTKLLAPSVPGTS